MMNNKKSCNVFDKEQKCVSAILTLRADGGGLMLQVNQKRNDRI